MIYLDLFALCGSREETCLTPSGGYPDGNFPSVKFAKRKTRKTFSSNHFRADSLPFYYSCILFLIISYLSFAFMQKMEKETSFLNIKQIFLLCFVFIAPD